MILMNERWRDDAIRNITEENDDDVARYLEKQRAEEVKQMKPTTRLRRRRKRIKLKKRGGKIITKRRGNRNGVGKKK